MKLQRLEIWSIAFIIDLFADQPIQDTNGCFPLSDGFQNGRTA